MHTQDTADTDSIERRAPGWSSDPDIRHVVRLTDPADFDDAVEAANTIGLRLRNCKLQGSWVVHDDAPEWETDLMDVTEVETTGRKWFHVRVAQLDTDVTIRIRPQNPRSTHTRDGLDLIFE